MPTVGDEIRGEDIGRIGGSARSKFVWVHCPSCNEERWTQKKSSLNPVNNTIRRCAKCAIKYAKQFSHGSAQYAIKSIDNEFRKSDWDKHI
jgi:ribosomal protein S27E